jgi:aryl-alcohol dehydrogenase-like predicted oxidoreductase
VKKRRIGSLEVSVVGLGCNNFGWRLDDDASLEVLAAAVERGITFFDTADKYGGTRSEELVGRALRGCRSEVVIATKFGGAIDERRKGAHPDYVVRAAEASLRRLGTDYIDLYQLHTPDPEVPIGDTLEVLDRLVRAGKVREIGCSNFSLEQIREAEGAVRDGAARMVSLQNELSLLAREATGDVLPECAKRGIAFLPYYPLANGLLTGKVRRTAPPAAGTRLADEERYRPLVDERNLSLVEELTAFAESRGRTILELAFAWLLAHEPVASVIAGATSKGQVGSNVAAAGWELSEGELEEVARITG